MVSLLYLINFENHSVLQKKENHMHRLIRAQNYLEGILTNNHSGSSNHFSKAVGTDLELGQITGKYQDCHYEKALLGFGMHFDGFLHVSLDEAVICHNSSCQNWAARIAAYFQIGSQYVSVVRVPRARAFYSTSTEKAMKIAHQNLALRNSYGTLGGYLYPKYEGDSFRIFSNNHVLADSNGGLRGDTVYSMENAKYRIGQLENFQPLYSDIPNYLDLAVAKLEGYYPTKHPVPCQTRAIQKQEVVMKFGATSGVTTGKVVSNSYRITIEYNGTPVLFKDQLVIVSTTPGQSFSQGGDSGSMIRATHDNSFAGLLFAGNKFQTFANPGMLVVQKLKEWRYL